MYESDSTSKRCSRTKFGWAQCWSAYHIGRHFHSLISRKNEISIVIDSYNSLNDLFSWWTERDSFPEGFSRGARHRKFYNQFFTSLRKDQIRHFLLLRDMSFIILLYIFFNIIYELWVVLLRSGAECLHFASRAMVSWVEEEYQIRGARSRENEKSRRSLALPLGTTWKCLLCPHEFMEIDVLW